MRTELRQAETSDIETIQELNTELSEMEAERYDPTINVEWTLSDQAADWYRKRINQSDGFAYVVEDNETVVGYAIGACSEPEAFREVDKIAEMETMFLKPEYRGEGIGSELMNEFKDWAEEKDVERLRVEASADNKGAIRFYRENGFKDYSLTLEEDF
jgi:RimJ/RimL family protein N-acetyltransferase